MNTRRIYLMIKKDIQDADQKKNDLLAVYKTLLKKAKLKRLSDWSQRIEKRIKELTK